MKTGFFVKLKEVCLPLGSPGPPPAASSPSPCWTSPASGTAAYQGTTIITAWFSQAVDGCKFNSTVRHIYKKSFWAILSVFHSKFLTSVYMKKNSKKQYGYHKTQKRMLILNPLKILQKKLMRKSYRRKIVRKREFLSYISVCQSFPPITFLHFFSRIKNQH